MQPAPNSYSVLRKEGGKERGRNPDALGCHFELAGLWGRKKGKKKEKEKKTTREY